MKIYWLAHIQTYPPNEKKDKMWWHHMNMCENNVNNNGPVKLNKRQKNIVIIFKQTSFLCLTFNMTFLFSFFKLPKSQQLNYKILRWTHLLLTHTYPSYMRLCICMCLVCKIYTAWIFISAIILQFKITQSKKLSPLARERKHFCCLSNNLIFFVCFPCFIVILCWTVTSCMSYKKKKKNCNKM